MPPSLKISPDAEGELEVVLSDSERVGEGEPVRYIVTNDGDSHFKDVGVAVEGDGASFVELGDSADGPWISAVDHRLALANVPMGETATFYARALFSFEDREQTYGFEFVLDGVSYR
jgi:hypothetical protein